MGESPLLVLFTATGLRVRVLVWSRPGWDWKRWAPPPRVSGGGLTSLSAGLNASSSSRRDWLTIQQRIADHSDFERYFLKCSEDDLPWSENIELLDSADTRIPFDVLDTPEAETVFRNHVNALQAEVEMRE